MAIIPMFSNVTLPFTVCDEPGSPSIIQAVNTPSRSKLKDDVTISGTTFTPQSSLPSLATHSPRSTTPPSLNCSPTPDHASNDLTSADHVPLSQRTTSPAVDFFADFLVANGKLDLAMRHTASANQLTRILNLFLRIST